MSALNNWDLTPIHVTANNIDFLLVFFPGRCFLTQSLGIHPVRKACAQSRLCRFSANNAIDSWVRASVAC